MTSTIIFLTTGIFILSNTLHASRTCRIIFPERPITSPTTAFLFDGKESQSVTLPNMNLSEVIELPSKELILTMTSNKITDPKTLSPKAPRLIITEEITDFYIIVTPDPENTDFPVKMNLVDTGGGKLKPGETLWYNFTKDRIAAKLGAVEMSVDPMGRTITKDPAPASGYFIARFAYQYEGKGAFAPITEQSWWHDANCRHLGFVYSSGGKLPKIYFFRDFRLPKSVEKEIVEGEITEKVVE